MNSCISSWSTQSQFPEVSRWRPTYAGGLFHLCLLIRTHHQAPCHDSDLCFLPSPQKRVTFLYSDVQIFNTVPDVPLTNAQLHLSRKKSSDSKPPSCSERPLTLFHAMLSTEKRESATQGQGGMWRHPCCLHGLLWTSLLCAAGLRCPEGSVS